MCMFACITSNHNGKCVDPTHIKYQIPNIVVTMQHAILVNNELR